MNGANPNAPSAWLLNDEFYKSYMYGVGCISSKYHMRPHVADDTLVAWHTTWKNNINRAVEMNVWTPDAFFDEVFQSLAIGLCSCKCINYVIDKALPLPSAEHQRLIEKHPATYTGLQFVRNEYISLSLEEQGISSLEHFHYLELDDPELAIVISRVDGDPREAGDFLNLLHLRRRTQRP